MNELGKFAIVESVFEKSKSKERNPNWKSDLITNFKIKILSGIPYKTDQSFAPQIIFRKFKKYDFIIISNFFTLTGILLILYLKSININYILMSEGGFLRNDNKLLSKLKNYLISNSKYCLSGSNLGVEFFIGYGKGKEGVFKYPFSSIYENEIIDLSCLDLETKSKFKEKIGFEYEKIIISVGQMTPRKGHDILIKAFGLISDRLKLGLLIIGGVPSKELLDLKSQLELENVHFIDFKSKSELNDYYKASDLFVLATREDEYGLVINEAMAKGLPIITTNKCGAGVDLIDNGKNGYLLYVNEPIDLALKISIILNDNCIRRNMSHANLEKIADYTLEKMGLRVYENLNSIISKLK